MYRITCAYGTNRTAWTWAEAQSWLAHSGPQAAITHRFTGRFIAGRNWSRA